VYWSLVSAAVAGPLGPLVEDVLPLVEVSAPTGTCDRDWPYELVRLPTSDFWVEFRPEHAWGTPVMVHVLEHAVNRLALHHPGSPPLLVGDIAREQGGALPPHRTHDDGRSADIGLFGWSGRVEDLHGGFPRLAPSQLDVERTWAVMDALLATGEVEHILLDQAHIDRIRGWLLETGRKTPDELARIFPDRDGMFSWSMTGIVRHAPNHADHLHVRVRCGELPPFPGT
jgi:hypothetical protein